MSKQRNGLVKKIKARLIHAGPLFTISRWCLETARTAYIRAVRTARGIDKNKIVFSCLMARTYGDNLKPISEMLHAKRPDAKIVWMFRDPESKKGVTPDYVVCCDPISRRGLAEYATARVWVDNFTLGHYLKRRKGQQFYLNTWHGDRAFKKYAYDAFPNQRRRMEEDCDLVLTGSDFGERVLRSAFRYQGETFCYGSPRNDCLVNYDPEKAAAIRKKIGVEEGVRLLIFCPTFRDSSRQTALKSGVDLEKALDDLERVTGAKWKCLFRAHHLHTAGLALKESGRMLDMTGYEDMADLLLISDALITDYSSAAMDFCLLNRPIFLYQDDLEDYTHNDRGLHFSMEDSPFLVAKNQRELTELIEKTGPEQAAENCRAIEAFFGFHETGRATEKVCEKIMEWMA